MGASFQFYIFQSKDQLKKYNEAIRDLSIFNDKMAEKYHKEYAKAYEDLIYKNISYPKILNAEEEILKEKLESLESIYKGEELEYLYGNSLDSFISAYFKKYYEDEWINYMLSDLDYDFIITREMIDNFIAKAEEVLNHPEKSEELLPALKRNQMGDCDEDSDEYYHYTAKDGKFYNTLSLKHSEGTEDLFYINGIKQFYKGFIKAKQLLNANPELILVYFEIL